MPEADRFVLYIAVSLDGFIARPDGDVDWLAAYPAQDVGYDDFYAGISAIVMGRTSFDHARALGDWPFADRRTLVVSSRPLEDAPAGVTHWGDGLPALRQHLLNETTGMVWIFGGGRLLQGCLRHELVDRLDIYVIPRLLGDGIPLFPDGGPEVALTLADTRACEHGIVRQCYRVDNDAAKMDTPV